MDGLDFRAAADGQSSWRNQDACDGRRMDAHEAIQERGAFETQALQVVNT